MFVGFANNADMMENKGEMVDEELRWKYFKHQALHDFIYRYFN